MRTTADGKPYALLMDRNNGDEVEVHPRLYRSLKTMIGNGFRSDGQIIIQIAGGQIVDVRLNVSAEVLEHSNGKSKI